jgi:Domain of unknown function (DUF4928)
MTGDLTFTLQEFTKDRKFNGRGPLSVALVVTQHARNMGLPLDSEKLLTEGGGQVLGLGKSAVQAILYRYGIERVLAAEGGRTSRGSICNMREYVALLNRIHGDGPVDLQAIEAFWVAHVQEFFAAKPFRVRLDASSSLRFVVRDILEQTEERQKATLGVRYVGAVMQHMVGAKLDCALGPGKFQHNSFTTLDEQSGRKGDFFVGDVAIHVTTSPGEAAIERCSDNLNDGHRPILVTRQRDLTVAEALAENVGLGDRIDIFEIEQFIALNLYEMGKFVMEGRRTVLKDFVTHYNEIIDEVETDPSLRIELRV